MPKIRWTDLPPIVRQHFFDRVADLGIWAIPRLFTTPRLRTAPVAKLGWHASAESKLPLITFAK